MPSRNPFAVLGLPFDATADAIKAAWRRLARENHPDLTSGDSEVEKRANRRMAEINGAYQELRDPEKRRQHREAGARQDHGERAWSEPSQAAHGEWRTREASASPPGWAPRARPTRPVTGRIDTSSLFQPRNTVLHPLSRSPLPGLPPRPREAFERELPRASDPTGPTLRRPGMPDYADLPTLEEALETELRFGKFEGRTLREVAALEPSYVAWVARTIGRDPELLSAARVVLQYLERTGVREAPRAAGSAPPPS